MRKVLIINLKHKVFANKTEFMEKNLLYCPLMYYMVNVVIKRTAQKSAIKLEANQISCCQG
jgi:hypothetical protein